MNEDDAIERPVIVIGAPRSGTTILRNCLALHPELWHPRAESHPILEGPLHPAPAFTSNRATATDVQESDCDTIRASFYRRAMNLNVLFENPEAFFKGRTLLERAALRLLVPAVGALSKVRKGREIRLLEKTPKNSLRVSLLNRLFPDAYFIWNKRHPKDNVDSLVDGWRTTDSLGPIERPRFATYEVAGDLDLQDYEGTAWKFALVPEWRSLAGKRVADVAVWQYLQCNRYALEDFRAIDAQRVFEVKHENFVRNPLPVVRDILDWSGLSRVPAVERFADTLPKVNDTQNAERTEAGLRYPKEVRRALGEVTEHSELTDLVHEMGYAEPTAGR